MIPRVWMNITSTLKWNGEPVGIIRTEEEVAKGLFDIYKDRIGFCYWDNSGFININYKNYFNRNIYYKHNNYNKNKKLSKDKIKNFFWHLTPKPIRPVIDLLSNYCRRKIEKIKKRKKINIKVDFIPDLSIFKKGDVFISMGADWDNSPFEYYHMLRKNGVKVITCCYDLVPVIFPQYCEDTTIKKFSSYFIDLAYGSDGILCVSKCSEKDLLSFLDNVGSVKPLTKVIRLGSNLNVPSKITLNDNIKSIINDKYILYVSTIERRKNHDILYKTYHKLLKDGYSVPKLVFVGMHGWKINDTLNDIELDPITKGHIILAGRVNDYELSILYKNALFTVFPSLYEGWGLGVAESLEYGKFVISSSNGSLPEVGGDLIWYIDPWDINTWCQKILELSNSPNLLESLERNITINYKTQTWKNCSIDISNFIDKFLL